MELTYEDADVLLEAQWSAKPAHVLEDLGRTLRYVTEVRNVDERRWADIHMMVFEDVYTGEHLGFHYETPASESQDMQDQWSYIQPELVPVKEVITTTWVIND